MSHSHLRSPTRALGLALASLASWLGAACLSSCEAANAQDKATPPAAPAAEDWTAGHKGLPISAPAPSFSPLHLTGPHAGKTACPLCVYGLVPQLQIWVQEAHVEVGIQFAQRAEAMRAAYSGKDAPVPYVILVPSAGGQISAATDRRVRDAELAHVFFVQVPSWEDAETSRLYGHSDHDKPSVRMYVVVNRRLFQRFEAPQQEQWRDVEKAVADAAAFVSTHDVTDAQIAPPWEPGKRMEIEFRVVDAQGEPMRKVKVSAMQTDEHGHYTPQGWNRRAPRLSALAWTDSDGRITFRTIMPGGYPADPDPAHIHFGADVRGQQRWRTLWFEGDARLTPERRQWADKDEETVVVAVEDIDGVLRARHTFVIE